MLVHYLTDRTKSCPCRTKAPPSLDAHIEVVDQRIFLVSGDVPHAREACLRPHLLYKESSFLIQVRSLRIPNSLLSIPAGTNLSVGGYSVGTHRPSLTILCFQVPKCDTTGQLGNGRNIWRRLWEQFHHFIIKAFSPREVFYQSSNDEIC